MKKNKKTILITGSGSGLGRELAQRFYRSGEFNICLLGRNKNKLLETSKNFDQGKYLVIPCDIRKYKQVVQAFKKIKLIYKKVDILINNAGIFEMQPIEKTTPKLWSNMIATNTSGPLYCTKEAIKLMNGSQIINILSIATEKDFPFNSAYAASKYALKGLMNSLKEELKNRNIYISNISPGRIDTDIWDKKIKGQSPKEIAEIIYTLSTQKTTYVSSISLLPK